MTELITAEYALSLLPARPVDAHKYTFGKLLVVAGSPQYPGAAGLATAAAARAGAGLVCLATGRSSAGGPGRIPEVIYTLLPEVEWGVLGENAADELLKSLAKYQAMLVGPGLGREQSTRRFLERLLGLDAPRPKSQIGFRLGADPSAAEQERPELLPTVLDADALNLLSEHLAPDPERRSAFFLRSSVPADQVPPASDEGSWWNHLPRGRCVLTPHAGEMARLLGVAEVDGDPERIAADAAVRWGQIIVLKGPTTIIAHPEGPLLRHEGANPALATAGTGDVLAGVITALLAQGLAPFDAAALGVYLHGAAGRLVLADIGDMGALASDLLPRLPLAIKALRG